jgi:23S rRNA pseudouridine2605 synthase
MRLNKYIAHCGVCSRRKAVDLIKGGEIKVNGEVEKLPYVLIGDNDVVEYKGEKILPPVEQVYWLMNKPKNVITTASDEHGRKTVMDLLPYIPKGLHYVGRLDRMTTGLLLLTNDGDLTRKLSHPSSEVKKIYSVTLERPMEKEDLTRLRMGLELEDGFVKPDKVDYDKTKGEETIGITLHSGKNRVIRRMILHLGYNVITLDRVYFAGLTKKDLPRGRFRALTEQEVIMLKHFV